MQNQGIKFNLISKEKAKEFLSESNYFFKLKTFVKNYDKDKKGKYIKTRFCISKRNKYYRHFIRDIILELCLTCEHLLKTQINIHCSNDENQNGYEIVKNFLSQHIKNLMLFYLIKKMKKIQIYIKKINRKVLCKK